MTQPTNAPHELTGATLYDMIWGKSAHHNADPFILARYIRVSNAINERNAAHVASERAAAVAAERARCVEVPPVVRDAVDYMMRRTENQRRVLARIPEYERACARNVAEMKAWLESLPPIMEAAVARGG